MRGTITALEPQERRGGKRVNVFLDGRYAFSLDAEVAFGLRVGEEITDAAAATILERDEFQTTLDAALTFLGHRPRSEQEIRRRLARKAPPPTIVDRVLARLREYGLVNDEAFARYWVEQRQTFRPRGARLLKAELRQRGVPTDLAAEVAEETEGSADEDAYRAAQKKARQLSSLDERTFRTRLAQFLGRRGFDWDTIAPTVERIWLEVSTEKERDATP
jgi:regulatory protein